MRHTFEKHNPGSTNGIGTNPCIGSYYNSNGEATPREGLPIAIIAAHREPITFIRG